MHAKQQSFAGSMIVRVLVYALACLAIEKQVLALFLMIPGMLLDHATRILPREV